MSYNSVPTKEELPGYFKPGRGVRLSNFADGDFMCPKCKKYVDVDAYFSNTKLLNCFICENGHRYHFSCVDIVEGTDGGERKYLCPKCGTDNWKNCKNKDGYLYVEKTGGKKKSKRRKTHSKKRVNRKRRTQKKT